MYSEWIARHSIDMNVKHKIIIITIFVNEVKNKPDAQMQSFSAYYCVATATKHALWKLLRLFVLVMHTISPASIQAQSNELE